MRQLSRKKEEENRIRIICKYIVSSSGNRLPQQRVHYTLALLFSLVLPSLSKAHADVHAIRIRHCVAASHYHHMTPPADPCARIGARKRTATKTSGYRDKVEWSMRHSDSHSDSVRRVGVTCFSGVILSNPNSQN